MTARSLAIAFVAALTLACGPGFAPASEIERTRLVGVHVAPTDDPSVAAPAPGSEVDLTLWLSSPAALPPISTSLVVCAISPANRGAPGCAGPPLATLIAATPVAAEPRVRFTLPAGLRGDVLVFGALCSDGGLPALSMEAGIATCEGAETPGRAEAFFFSFPVASPDGIRNSHPSLDDELFTLDGAEWRAPPAALPYEACARASGAPWLPLLAILAEGDVPSRELAWTTSPDDRETVTRGEETFRETLQVSSFASAGRLTRNFTIVEGEADDTPMRPMRWTPPARADVPDEGLLVRFFWVARDLRGGFARTERALCVVRE